MGLISVQWPVPLDTLDMRHVSKDWTRAAYPTCPVVSDHWTEAKSKNYVSNQSHEFGSLFRHEKCV